MVTATTPLTSSLTCVKGEVKITSIFNNAFDKLERNSKALTHLTSSLTRVNCYLFDFAFAKVKGVNKDVIYLAVV